MSRVIPVSLVIAALGLPGAPPARAAANLRDGFETTELARNDDGSSAQQELGFTVNLFGTQYENVYVNNNGNITFDAALSTYTPFSLTSTTRVIVAPFFADVDTRSADNGAQPTRFGQGMAGTRPAFGATWRNVGFYSSRTHRLNRFQVVLIERTDTGPGNFDIEFNYEQIQWETGQASGGDANGLGGTSARAGYSKGTGEANTFYEFPGSAVPGSFLDPGGLIAGQRDSGVPGRYVFAVRNGNVTNLDTDGDKLSDSWEENGLDVNGDGTIDLDLPGMGADKNHKDIFVEVDHMVRPAMCIFIFCWARRSFAPFEPALTDVRTAFSRGDITNPDGAPGIRVHIDSGAGAVMNNVTGATWGAMSRANEVPYDPSLGTRPAGGEYDWTEFDAIKASNFNAARASVFHYAVYADVYALSRSSGISHGIPGADFIITDGMTTNGFTRIQERGTFMHEFGHNLGLRHGGDDHQNFEPNFLSIMNYSFQFPGLMGARSLDYSRQRIDMLNENRLNEAKGLEPDSATTGVGTTYYCRGVARLHPAPARNVDWNCNGRIDRGSVFANINNSAGTTLRGYDDWAHIVFDGGAIAGATAGEAPAATTGYELTIDDARRRNIDATDGDGAIDIEGPSVLIPDTGTRQIVVDVENPGTEAQSYTVALSAPGLSVPQPSQTVEVPGGGTRRLSFDVGTTGLAPGTLTATATLSVGTTLRGTDTESITVPDASEPGFEASLQEALGDLGDVTDPGLDPAIYETFVEMTATQLGAPIAEMVRPATQKFLLDTPTRIAWTATDSDGIASYDVRHRSATPTGEFGPYATIADQTTDTQRRDELVPGTHCWQVLARDTTGTVGGFSGARCVGIPMPIASGNESGRWSTRDVAAAYRGEVLSTRQNGAEVLFTGIRYQRLVLIASRVPGGGKVAVFVGNKREATIDLAGSLSRRKTFPIDVRSSTSGGKRVRIEVLTDGKLVEMEGLGVLRA